MTGAATPNGLTIGQTSQVMTDPCPLSARELQIVELLAEGMTNSEIAERIHLSPYTIKSHLGRIFRQIAATDRAHAVAISLRAGWMK